jgi:hypothetical protein
MEMPEEGYKVSLYDRDVVHVFSAVYRACAVEGPTEASTAAIADLGRALGKRPDLPVPLHIISSLNISISLHHHHHIDSYITDACYAV